MDAPKLIKRMRKSHICYICHIDFSTKSPFPVGNLSQSFPLGEPLSPSPFTVQARWTIFFLLSIPCHRWMGMMYKEYNLFSNKILKQSHIQFTCKNSHIAQTGETIDFSYSFDIGYCILFIKTPYNRSIIVIKSKYNLFQKKLRCWCSKDIKFV